MKAEEPDQDSVSNRVLGVSPEGQRVHAHSIANGHGMELRVMEFGANILSLSVPDRHGNVQDIVLGFDRLSDYFVNKPYFGAVIGRYANRIAGGEFTLDGVEYHLPLNNGSNSLHGGVKGFDKVMWRLETPMQQHTPALRFAYTSADGEQGYPGTVRVHVTYTVTPDNELIVDYEATTDKPTPLNLTQHTYFNLSGGAVDTILDHELLLKADSFTPVDENLIPTGEMQPVENTPMDFNTPTRIGDRIQQSYPQLLVAGGYDHNFVIPREDDGLEFVARVYEPLSKRSLEVHTTEPGVQFYSGNFLDGSPLGKRSRRYGRHSGFCLETQHFPDSPNHPNFPSTILIPGHAYASRTVFRFE